jgi:uncharacterized protein Yka (UPF0111/DUF47 family)
MLVNEINSLEEKMDKLREEMRRRLRYSTLYRIKMDVS